ncbi:MAG TPA: protein kinase, partial [Gemmataceae bacterium]
MSEPDESPDSTLDWDLACRVEQIRRRFEAAWRRALAGAPRPSLETFLAEGPEADRAVLAAELEQVERSYLRALAQGAPGEETLAFTPEPPACETPAPGREATTAPPERGARDAERGTGVPAPAGTGVGPDRPESRAPPPAFPGEEAGPRLDGYELLGRLGYGGMGVVYKARQLKLDRVVAVKMVLAGAHAAPEQLARFRTESQAIARLQHPNIVQIYEVGEHDGLPYFSLEFVGGGSLAQKAGGQPQPARDAAHLVETLARAMDFAHRRGVVHRDLKPANVLLTEDGVPKITDFGLAKCLGDTSGQTRTGALVGTPSYMAPEQARGGLKEVGPAADVYALGAILYELLTGRPPFAKATAMDTVMAVLADEPVPPGQLRPGVPRDLETVCLKCLRKEPGARYPSAAALAEDLHCFLAGEPIRARPLGRLGRLGRWCRRHPDIAALAATVFLLLATVAVGATVAAVWIAGEKRAADLSAEAARLAQHEAEAQREKAAQSARVADEQRGLALDALGTLVNEVQRQLGDAPGTQALKQRLLRTALAGLRKLAASADRSPLVDLNTAEAHRRMGEVFLTLGRTKEAGDQYEKMHAITRALEAADPADPQVRRNASVSFALLGDIRLLLGDRPAARAYYEESLRRRRELSAAEPLDKGRRVDLAQIYVKLGNVSAPAEARAFYEESLALRKALAAEDPTPEARRDVWVSHAKLADLGLRLRDAGLA